MTSTTTTATRASVCPTRSRFCCSGVLLRLDRLEQPGDLAELGVHAGGDDHRAAAAVGHGRAGVDHVRAVADGQLVARRAARVCFSTGSDSPVSAASSTCRLTASISRPSAGTLSPAASRMTSPGTSSRAGTSTRLAVAEHGRRGRRHLAQRLDGALGAVLLDEAEQHREQHDHGDDDGLDRVPEHRRERRRDQQDDDEDVLELVEQEAPRRCRWAASSSLGPNSVSRRAASSAVSPVSRDVPSLRRPRRVRGRARGSEAEARVPPEPRHESTCPPLVTLCPDPLGWF